MIVIPFAVPGLLTRFVSVLRTHLGFAILLGVGLLLRVLVLVAYPAAFWFPDSSRYLEFSRGWRLDFMRQGGYSLLLKVLRQTGSLFSVSVLQHLIGLAVAVGLYALLVRRGLPHWLAVLGVAPVVLDAYELTVEHFVLSDTLFIGFVVAGLLALLWPRRPTVVWAGAAGVLLAASSTVRVVSVALVLATLGYLLVRRAGWRAVTSFAVAVAIIFGGYATWFRLSNGTFGFSAFGPTFLYGRVAPFADCDRLRLTEDERRLCPTEPVGVRPTRADFYVWDEQSPVRGVPLATQESFVYKVFTQQPLDTIGAILKETGLYLRAAPQRTGRHLRRRGDAAHRRHPDRGLHVVQAQPAAGVPARLRAGSRATALTADPGPGRVRRRRPDAPAAAALLGPARAGRAVLASTKDGRRRAHIGHRPAHDVGPGPAPAHVDRRHPGRALRPALGRPPPPDGRPRPLPPPRPLHPIPPRPALRPLPHLMIV